MTHEAVAEQATEATRSKAKPVAWSLLAVAGISVIFSTELPILRDEAGDSHLVLLELIRDRYLFIPHALGGVLATFIGPMQFSSRLRRRRLGLHRTLGRVYASSVVVAGLCAIAIDWDRAQFLATTVKATAWLLCTLFAVMAARNRRLVQHRQWMIRSYAVTYTFVVLRVLNFWPAYADMPDATFINLDIIVTFLAVSLPSVAFDWRALTTRPA